MAEFTESLKANKSFELAFVKAHVRSRLPNNTKHIRSCFDLLSVNSHSRLFNLLKPVFTDCERLSCQKTVELLNFFYTNTSKQLEIFQNNEFNFQAIEAYKDDFIEILYQFKTQSDSNDRTKQYYDCMSSLLAIYIDLELIALHSKTEKSKSIKKSICSNLFYVSDFSIECICDALLQLTSLKSNNVAQFSSVIRKLYFQCEHLRLSNVCYLRLLLVYARFYAISKEFAELYKGNFLAVRRPQHFSHFLNKTVKFHDEGDLIETLINESNVNIISDLMDYLAHNENKHLNKKNKSEDNLLAFTLITNDRPQSFKSNSKIVITPLKKRNGDFDDEYILEDLMANIETEKLLKIPSEHDVSGGYTNSDEVAKIIDHIDNLVEEKHRENSRRNEEDADDALYTHNIISDSPIPETPIKNLNLDMLKFSPSLLDKFSKSPVVVLKHLPAGLINSPVRVELKDDDYKIIVTPAQSPKCHDNIAFNVSKKDAKKSVPMKVESFKSKLSLDNAKNFKKVVVNVEEKKARKCKEEIKPITFTNRITMYLRKDGAVPVQSSTGITAEAPIDISQDDDDNLSKSPAKKSARKRTLSKTLTHDLEERRENELIVISDSPVKKDTPKRGASRVKDRKQPEIIPETDTESIDDTDNDETFVRDTGAGKKREFTSKEDSPVKRYNLRQSARKKIK